VHYAIIGTKAVNAPHFVADVCLEFPGHIMVGLDAKDGKVAIDGWSKLSNHDVIDLAQHFEKDGVEAIIYTDISRDGMMQHLDYAALRAMLDALRAAIPGATLIYSGGVTSVEDIIALNEYGLEGAIIGRALYDGRIDLEMALAAVATGDGTG
jgi:phosphoribosylformimino-5-aminoimidazole carboxamide ribotide isomerase